MSAAQTHRLPSVEEYQNLIPVARQLYEHTNSLSWQMLLPLFLLSIVFGYSQDLGLSGSVLVRLKKLILTALLLVSFPYIAEFLQILGVEIAKSIDNMAGIDMLLEAASKRAESYSFSLQSILNLQGNLVMGALTLISFLILLAARFLLLAFQHFYWLLLISLGPFLLLTNLFESSSGISKGLFKNMIQVACWPVIWSILSAFLKALPFASVYSGVGDHATLFTLNLILAVALLFSPFIISQLCEGVSLSVGDTLRRGVLRAVSVANPKALALKSASSLTGSATKAASSKFIREAKQKSKHFR